MSRPRSPTGPKHRDRPLLGATVAPDVDAAVRALAVHENMSISLTVETLLRAALGLPEAGPTP